MGLDDVVIVGMAETDLGDVVLSDGLLYLTDEAHQYVLVFEG